MIVDRSDTYSARETGKLDPKDQQIRFSSTSVDNRPVYHLHSSKDHRLIDTSVDKIK